MKLVSYKKDNKINIGALENEIIIPFTNEYQSTLTTRIINDILIEGNTNLPNYQEACSSHIPFIEGALNSYNRISNSNSSICPIT